MSGSRRRYGDQVELSKLNNVHETPWVCTQVINSSVDSIESTVTMSGEPDAKNGLANNGPFRCCRL